MIITRARLLAVLRRPQYAGQACNLVVAVLHLRCRARETGLSKLPIAAAPGRGYAFTTLAEGSER
ncbi:MAG: hypothetical protein L0H19_00625 [Salinisphaera sp.]|nr:hypothetical protein [Salinisphaera sp.]